MSNKANRKPGKDKTDDFKQWFRTLDQALAGLPENIAGAIWHNAVRNRAKVLHPELFEQAESAPPDNLLFLERGKRAGACDDDIPF